MRLDSRTMRLRGRVVDAAGRRIPFVIWCDTVTGEYEAWKSTADGQAIVAPRETVRGTAPGLRFIEDQVKTALAQAAPKPEAPPIDGALAERLKKLDPRRLGPDATQECEEPLCHRRAEWRTGDEQQVEPETDGQGRKWERGVLTRGHYYCSAHYRPPTSTSVRGVESEIQITGARPQW